MQKGHSLIFLLVGILIIVAASGAYYLGRSNTQKIKACTMEAKVCTDGSAVGRVGPNCEFAICPSSFPLPTNTGETANWKTYTSSKYGLSFKYPPSATLNSDTENGDGVSYFIGASGEDFDVNMMFGIFQSNSNTQEKERFIVNGRVWEVVSLDPKGICGVGLGPCAPLLAYETENKGYTVSVIFRGSYPNRTIPDQLISSFKFTNNPQSGCIPKFEVETGEELTASEDYAQKCLNQTTESSCNKVDILRASTNNFGNSDGIPDCMWVSSK